MMAGLPDWKNPKLNVMGPSFDNNITNIQREVGWPATQDKYITREKAGFKDSDYIQLDIGGEGYHESDGIKSGFNSAINVNAQLNDSQPPNAYIPHLVLVKRWDNNPSFPFAGHFADYMTMQGAPLTPKNISEFARCIRPGGEIGLWVADTFNKDIQTLADHLDTYVEWESWSEFDSLGSSVYNYSKKTIPVPGADYMIGYSMGDRWFFISRVTGRGTLGPETDKGRWRNEYNALATYKIRGRTYMVGWSKSIRYCFLCEILPGGKVGSETYNGYWRNTYDVMTTTQILGKTYLIGLSTRDRYLFISELLDGGLLGNETYNESNFKYDQVIPFSRDGLTYLLFFCTWEHKCRVVRLLADGSGWEQTSPVQRWNNPYVLVIVNVQSKPFLFGQNQYTRYWFLQRIDEGGILGSETSNGHMDHSYATLSSYTHGNRAYIFGQDSRGTHNTFLREVFNDGTLSVETYRENWRNAYENVRFYTQYN